METKLCVNEREYEILKLLGHGKGGYSYLVRRKGKLYVLKQIHHEPCDYYSFGNKIEAEQRDYHTLLQTGIPMPKMLDIDIPNERIVKEYIDGPTIYDLVKQDAMKDTYLRQVQEMAQTVCSAGLNIDYFPRISSSVMIGSIILTMNATPIWMNGTLKTGESNIGLKPKNLWVI